MREAPSGRIYVIEKLRHLDSLLVGTRSWWCVEPTATPGQLCALYLKKQGIALLFRFLAFARAPEPFCRLHGMETGDIEILARAPVPVSAEALRKHPTLKSLPAIRRSFQRRSFRLDEPYLAALSESLGWVP